MSIELIKLLVATGALWAVVQFALLPRVARGEKETVQRAASRSVLQFVRMLLFVATVTYAAVAFIVFTIGLSASGVEGVASWAHHAREGVERVAGAWSIAAIVLLTLALGVTYARLGARKEESRLRDHSIAEWRRIDALRQSDALQYLEPTAEMQGAIEKIRAIDAFLEQDHGNGVRPAQLDTLRAHRENLIEELYVRDTLRRVAPAPPPADPEPPAGARAILADQIGTLIGSRGAVSTLTGTRKAAALVSTVLLCLSLVGITADSTASHALDAKVVSLHRLEVRNAAQEGEKAANDVLPPAVMPSARPLSAAETASIKVVSHGFARRLESVPSLRAANVSPQAVAKLESAHVRASILNTLHAGTRQGIATVPSLDEKARRVAQRIDGVDVPDPVAEHVESRLRERLSHADALSSESFLKRLAQEFRTPAGIDAIRSSLTGEALYTMADVAGGPQADALGVQLKEFIGESGGETVKSYYEIAFDEFVVDERARGGAYAVEHMMQSNSSASRFGEMIYREAAPHYADWGHFDHLALEAAAHPPSAPDQDIRVPRWAQLAPPGGETAFATTYRDVAPSGLGDDLRTVKARLDASIGASGLTTEFKPPPVEARVPGQAIRALETGSIRGATDQVAKLAGGFLRGRSYTMLRGFTRIGGVLIGDAPRDPATTLDCRTLMWDPPVRGMVQLHLSGPRCPAHVAALPVELVARALAYAADGRPVATTMLQASPLLDMSVHLHPTLVDRPIGQDAVEIDTFVDSFYRPTYGQRSPRARALLPPLYRQVEQRATDDIGLYHAALAAMLFSWWEHAGDADRRAHHDVVETFVEVARSLRALPEMLAEEGTRPNGAPRLAVLTKKAAYFDEKVTGIVRGCLGRPSAKPFVDCVIAAYGKRSDRERERIALDRAVIWRFESGVRESSFNVAQSLDVNADIQSSGSHIGPFEFEIHVAFSSAPQFAKSTSEALLQDAEPYGFPELEPGIAGAITEKVHGRPELVKVVRDMALFTRAQRLFRLGLAGRLGEAFPKEQLVQLAAMAAPMEAARPHTARYLAHPESYVILADDYVRELSAVPPNTDRADVADGRAVAARLSACAANAYHQAWAANRLVFDGAICDLAGSVNSSAPCRTQYCALVRQAVTFGQTLRLRKDLRVADDDPRVVRALKSHCVDGDFPAFCAAG